jgi:hypothetical protein
MTVSRASSLVAALSSGSASTSTLYERVGYLALTRLGLVSYQAFRAELVEMSAAGLVLSETGADGSTVWRLAPSADVPER